VNVSSWLVLVIDYNNSRESGLCSRALRTEIYTAFTYGILLHGAWLPMRVLPLCTQWHGGA
jgi:hypothetical protein